MPTVELSSGTEMYYTLDDFTDPWSDPPETVVLIHGMAESHRSWFAWVPRLAREYSVLRLDLPGLGRSTIADLPAYEWSLTSVGRDINALLDGLGLGRVHVVGAKIGGSTALELAASYPERVATVVDIGGPLYPKGSIGTNIVKTSELAPSIAAKGVEQWARDTMPYRLGPEAPPAQLEWWTELMAGSDREVLIAATTAAAQIDLRDSLPRIEAPALLMTSAVSGLAGDEAAAEWARVPRGRREIIDAPGYHLSAIRPDECADHVLTLLKDNPL